MSITRTSFFAALAVALPFVATAAPTIGGCPVFPVKHYWNTRIDHLPKHSLSDTWIAQFPTTNIRQDFGTTEQEYGIPYSVVPGLQTAVPINYGVCDPGGGNCENYEDESDLGPYPIPPDAPIEGGNVAQPNPTTGDTHTLTIQSGSCFLYETYRSRRGPGGASWTVASSAKFDLNGFALRTQGWTSADAAGFAIFPGLVRHEEVTAGEIAHAIRFTISGVYGATNGPFSRGYIWPARHRAVGTNANRPPYGARFRLKSTYDVEGSGFLPATKVILRAFQRYGLVLADQGSNWFFSGVSNPGWSSTMFTQLQSVAAANFEAVDTTVLMINEDSAEALQPAGKHSDQNGDGRSDVFWRDSTGGLVYQWQMNGMAISGQSYLPGVPAAWSPVAIGDANGDGRADVLWRNATSQQNYLWALDGASITAQGYLPSVPTPWIVVGMGDADGDGRADVVWRNAATGANYLWLMNGVSVTSQGYLPSVAGTDWEVQAVADVTGDGRADVLWRNKANGQVYLWAMNGLAIASQGFLPSVPTDWEIAGAPDANGDGRADVLWRNKATGANYLWLMNGLAITGQGYLPGVGDVNWKVAGHGDYNGDGRGDVLWRHATSGANYLWLVNGLSVTSEGYLPSVSGSNWQPVNR